jgi:hypothetical protein
MCIVVKSQLWRELRVGGEWLGILREFGTWKSERRLYLLRVAA